VKLTVVIPTYNEAENLPKLFSALFDLRIAGLSVHIVDDNSPDGTGQLAEELASQYPSQAAVLHRSGKLGLGTAYLNGFEAALKTGAEAVGQMDADLSHAPEKLLELLLALEGCDVALGSRYIPGGSLDERWPLWRRGLSRFGNLYARAILGTPVKDMTGGFRIWRRETLLGMPLQRVRSNGYAFQVEMIYLAHLMGFTSKEVPIYFSDRRWGKSKMSSRIQLEAAQGVWLMRFRYRDLTGRSNPARHPKAGR
jgi:dolichol-phosphate mannosyltransferase